MPSPVAAQRSLTQPTAEGEQPVAQQSWQDLTQLNNFGIQTCADAQTASRRWTDELFAFEGDSALQLYLSTNNTDTGRLQLLPPPWLAPCTKLYGDKTSTGSKSLLSDISYLSGAPSDATCQVVSMGTAEGDEVSFAQAMVDSAHCTVHRLECGENDIESHQNSSDTQSGHRVHAAYKCSTSGGGSADTGSSAPAGAAGVELPSLLDMLQAHAIPRVDILSLRAEGLHLLPGMIQQLAPAGPTATAPAGAGYALPVQLLLQLPSLAGAEATPANALAQLKLLAPLFTAGYVLVHFSSAAPAHVSQGLQLTLALGCTQPATGKEWCAV